MELHSILWLRVPIDRSTGETIGLFSGVKKRELVATLGEAHL